MKQGNPFRNRVLTPALLVAGWLLTGVPINAAEWATSSAEGGERAGARQGAIEAIRKFRIANGFEISLFAHEPQLRNPVAFCFDEQGRLFVSETHRYRSSALDIRHYMDWFLDDLACRTVEDRRSMIRKHMGDDSQLLTRESELIRVLEDRDRDGRADTSRVFAEGFSGLLDGIASGVLARKGSVYFTNIPHLWKLEDRDRDGRADERESLSFGYGVRFSLTGHDLHGMKWGPDGKLYFTVGDRGADVTTREGRRLSYPDEGICFRCNPDGSDLEVFARGLRNPQELAFNEFGDLFTGDNDSDHGDRERWVHIVEGGDSGWRVGYQFSEQAPGGVWNAEALWQLQFPGQAAYLLPPVAHIDNGPSGLVYYPGTGLPESYRGHFFLCHFKGVDAVSGIKSFALEPAGASFSVGPIKELVWNVMPTDVDFGPDGYLYFSDWVEGWPQSERGRIYRMHVPEAHGTPEVRETQRVLAEGMDHRSERALRGLLGHPDMRVRQEAQFEFADRGRSVIPILLQVATRGTARFARIHALWGLGQMTARLGPERVSLRALYPLLADSDAEVRAQTAKVLGGGYRPADTARRLEPLLSDPSARVRFQAAMSLGRLARRESIPAVIEMLRENNDRDPYLRHSGIMALSGTGDPKGVAAWEGDESVAVRMAVLLTYRQWGSPAISTFLDDPEPLIRVEAARAINDVPINAAMPSLAAALDSFKGTSFQSSRAPEVDLVTPMWRRLINANYRLGGEPQVESLIRLGSDAAAPPEIRAEAFERLGQWLVPSPRDQVVGLYRPISGPRSSSVKAALGSALDSVAREVQTGVSVAALRAAGELEITGVSGLMIELVSDLDRDAEVRVAALEALNRTGSPLLEEALAVAQFDPSIRLRKAAIRLQSGLDPGMAATELNAVLVNGTVEEKQVALAALAPLPGSVADEIILRWLGKLIDGLAAPELALDIVEAAEARTDARIIEGLDQWRATLPTETPLGEKAMLETGGDAAMGRKVFFENEVAGCIRCHRYDGVGSDLGPPLDDLGQRLDRTQIVEAILYPNRAIAEGYQTVVLTRADGSVHAGMVKEEDDVMIILQPVEGEPVSVSKLDIQSRETGLSGMPEGYEALLSRQDIRNLVAFLAAAE